MLPDQTPAPQRRYVIVGAGLAGASTAFHLRRLGAEHVLLLERERLPDVHASGRNAAMVRTAMEQPELQALADESAAELHSGRLAAYRATGGLLLGQGEDDVKGHVPPARGRARFQPADGIVDVAGLLQRYLHGADVRYECGVLGVERHATELRVRTTQGDVRADVLINAAGAWAGEVGDLPLTPRNRTLYLSQPDEAIDPSWPFLWDLDAGYYLRPESGGWLLCACDERDAAPGDYVDEEEVLLDLGAKLRRHQPGLGDLKIARSWVGQRTFAPDGLPILGFDAGTPGLFHVAGLGGHGVTLSYAVGKLAAEALLEGRRIPEALSAGRLQPS